jgi:hypothetical protein
MVGSTPKDRAEIAVASFHWLGTSTPFAANHEPCTNSQRQASSSLPIFRMTR